MPFGVKSRTCWSYPSSSAFVLRRHSGEEFANQIANERRSTARHLVSQGGIFAAEIADQSTRLATQRYAPSWES